MEKAARIAYFRNFVFGVEDSLVSTVGLLSGVAIAGMSRTDIFTTGLILIFVEAISMAAGSFLSETSAEEYASHKDQTPKRSGIAAIVMFASYFISGFVPLAPYLFVPVGPALPLSIGFSLVALFALGIFGARLSKVGLLKNGIRMAVVGGLAIVVGITVGSFVA